MLTKSGHLSVIVSQKNWPKRVQGQAPLATEQEIQQSLDGVISVLAKVTKITDDRIYCDVLVQQCTIEDFAMDELGYRLTDSGIQLTLYTKTGSEDLLSIGLASAEK